MSKSTPISQLPNAKGQDDLNLDDDATVQEVLDQIAQSNQEQYQQPPVQHFVPQMPPQQMYNGSPQVMPQEFLIQAQQAQQQQNQNNWGGSVNNNNNNSPALIPKSRFNIDADMKTVFLIIGIVVIVQVLPIETFVYKYVSIEHVPYSGVMIKGVAAGAIFLLAKKYVI
jgi:hypothetical protein